MKRLLGLALVIAVLGGPAFAADNVAITAGSGTTLKTKDVGGGVQESQVLLSDSAGLSILGTAGTANANVITIQGIASMTPLLAAESGTWNITNISGTVSLPTGAATAAKQPALGTAGSASADVITIQGIASMTPLLAAESGTWNITNISGTVSLPTGASTSALQTTGNTALGGVADSAYAGSGSCSIIACLKGLYIAPNAGGGIPVTPTPNTSGGLSIKSFQVLNNTTSVAVDASPGQLYGIEAFNNSTTIAYIKLYNTAQGSTTCGSGTVVYRGMIPAPSAGGGGYISINSMGLPFSTAISACITTGFADNDTTAPAASTYTVNFYFR